MVQRRQDQALAQFQRALELDPLNNLIHAFYTMVLYAGKRYDEAIQEADSVLSRDPSETIAHGVLERSYVAKRMFPQVYALNRSDAMARNDSALLAATDRGYEQGGYRGMYREEARLLARRSRLANGGPLASPVNVAENFLMAGDTASALDWLQRAYEQHAPGLGYVAAFPDFDVVRDDPRFQDLLRRMGLPL
jgi:tetratricopeptide (TPR) repeat protein